MFITYSAVNTIWVLIGAALVFFMQAGFSMCEAGFTRAKNTGNILMKNLMDFCIGTPAFWLVGFGLMFGSGSAIIGTFDPLIRGDYSHILPAGVPLWAFAIFQTVFVRHLQQSCPEQWLREQNSVHTSFIQQRFLF